MPALRVLVVRCARGGVLVAALVTAVLMAATAGVAASPSPRPSNGAGSSDTSGQAVAALVGDVTQDWPEPAGGGTEGAAGAYSRPMVAPASVPPGTELGPVLCQGYSLVDRSNPWASAIQDIMTMPPFAPVRVGDGHGNVNWRIDPYHNLSWQLWLHTLRWQGSLLRKCEADGDLVALAHVAAVAKSWVAANSVSGWASTEAAEAVAHRAEVLICLALDAGRAQWLVDALDVHAAYMESHYAGWNNHGLDEDLALLDIGALLGRRAYADFAVNRIDDTVQHLVDVQGASVEQSAAYATYVYARLALFEQRMNSYGYTVPSEMGVRVARMPYFMAHETMPNGYAAQIGDGALARQLDVPGTPDEYPATLGVSGTPPTQRVAVYYGGYVFGRDAWTPFTTQAWYALRFGPARITHGHDDHTSLLYFARGHQVLTDAGFYGYGTDARQTFVSSAAAANVMTVPGDHFANVATTLTRSAYGPSTDYFEVTDHAYAGVTRYRSVLMVRGPDLALVMDRVFSASTRTYQQLWHLTPDQSTVVSGRSSAAAVPADLSARTYLVQIPLPGQSLPAGSTLSVKGRTSPSLQGWVAQQPYTFVAAPTIVMTRAAATTPWLTLVVPTRYNAKISWTAFSLGVDGYYHFTVVVDGTGVRLKVSGGGYLAREG